MLVVKGSLRFLSPTHKGQPGRCHFSVSGGSLSCETQIWLFKSSGAYHFQ